MKQAPSINYISYKYLISSLENEINFQLSHREIARRLSISATAVNKILNGKMLMSIEIAIKFSRLFPNFDAKIFLYHQIDDVIQSMHSQNQESAFSLNHKNRKISIKKKDKGGFFVR